VKPPMALVDRHSYDVRILRITKVEEYPLVIYLDDDTLAWKAADVLSDICSPSKRSATQRPVMDSRSHQ
jgi:hypothetical protein